MSKILDPTTEKPLEALANQEAQEQLAFIFTSQNYFNHTGLRIEEYTLISGVFPQRFPRFIAHGFVVVTLPVPAGKIIKKGEKPPQHRQPLDLPIEAENIQEAFAKAPDLLQTAAEQYQAQFEEDMKSRFAQAQLQKKTG